MDWTIAIVIVAAALTVCSIPVYGASCAVHRKVLSKLKKQQELFEKIAKESEDIRHHASTSLAITKQHLTVIQSLADATKKNSNLAETAYLDIEAREKKLCGIISSTEDSGQQLLLRMRNLASRTRRDTVATARIEKRVSRQVEKVLSESHQGRAQRLLAESACASSKAAATASQNSERNLIVISSNINASLNETQQLQRHLTSQTKTFRWRYNKLIALMNRKEGRIFSHLRAADEIKTQIQIDRNEVRRTRESITTCRNSESPECNCETTGNSEKDSQRPDGKENGKNEEDSNFGGELVDINNDDQEKLKTLDRIGTDKANAIVLYRTKNGRFQSIEDLTKVRGIGKSIFYLNKNHIFCGSSSQSDDSKAPDT